MMKAKRIVFNVTLFYITLYIPFSILVYTPFWLRFHSSIHRWTRNIAVEQREVYIRELNQFFLHQNQLVTHWTEKEKYHLAEVRGIFDFLFILFCCSILVTVIAFRKKFLLVSSRFNMICLGVFSLLLPVFSFFWLNVFHPLVFNNLAWKNTPSDISFFFMPVSFFKKSFLIILCFAFIFNFANWIISRHFLNRALKES